MSAASVDLSRFKLAIAKALIELEEACYPEPHKARVLAMIEIIKLGAHMHLSFGGGTESYVQAARDLRLQVESEIEPTTH